MKDLYGVGQEAEQELATFLGHRGYMVIPISSFTNNTGAKISAPMLVVGDSYSVSPDLLAIKDGKSMWIEVKRKSVPAYFYKWHCWVHGVDRQNIEAYRKAQKASGHPLFICVLEDKSPLTPDLYLEWHERRPNGPEAEDLQGARQWLWITLDDALEYGNFLVGNIEMVGPSNPEGCGLYWPRRCMRPFGQAA
jgi:hypothetical protein